MAEHKNAKSVHDIQHPRKSSRKNVEFFSAEEDIKLQVVDQVWESLPEETPIDVPGAKKPKPKPPLQIGRFIGFFFLGILCLGVIFFVYQYRQGVILLDAVSERAGIWERVWHKINPSGVENLSDTSPAAEEASDVASEGGFSLSEISEKLKAIAPVLKNAGRAYTLFQDFSRDTLILLDQLSFIEGAWPDLLFGSESEKIPSILQKVQDSLASLEGTMNAFQKDIGALDGVLPLTASDYLAAQVDLTRTRNFVGALIPWIGTSSERHVAVFFGNPSEIRPGGGFNGSYADVIIRGGKIDSIEIHDINDSDRLLDAKIVPPKQLQLITKHWRAADANWFFDIPSSTEKTLRFLEASSFHAASGTVFSGGVNISGKPVEDLLRIIGPIDLQSPKIQITSDNFLLQIQNEVQSGRLAGESYPKQILRTLGPVILEKVKTLSPEARKELFLKAKEWIEEKDVTLYFRDPGLAAFLEAHEATGRVYELPRDENIDYLAIANANIGGGKTDIFMKQKIDLRSQINEGGAVENHLVITRSHAAPATASAWHKVVNQNYVQVFLPSESRLVGASGGVVKKISTPLNYEKEGFLIDTDVQKKESSAEDFLAYPGIQSFAEFGKTVFAAWTRTLPGEKSEVIFDYSHRLAQAPREGETYQFVFEKQAAATGEYHFEILAPVGFRFKENSLPVFEYESSDPPGRLILNLTFEKAL